MERRTAGSYSQIAGYDDNDVNAASGGNAASSQASSANVLMSFLNSMTNAMNPAMNANGSDDARAADTLSDLNPALHASVTVSATANVEGTAETTSSSASSSAASGAAAGPLRRVESWQASALAEKVRREFQLGPDEHFEEEYSCWMMRDILIQGYMYLTDQHLLFLASRSAKPLPTKMGYVRKLSRKAPSFNFLWWCILEDGVLSYYRNAQNLFQPVGAIDLRNILHVHVHSSPATSQYEFDLVGVDVRYHFIATSAASLQEWHNVIDATLVQLRQGDHSMKLKLCWSDVNEASVVPVANLNKALLVQTVETSEIDAVNVINDLYFLFFRDVDKTLQHIQSLHSAAPRVNAVKKEAVTHLPSEPNGGGSWFQGFGVTYVLSGLFATVRYLIPIEEDVDAVHRELAIPADEKIVGKYSVHLGNHVARAKLFLTTKRVYCQSPPPLIDKVVVKLSSIQKVETGATLFYAYAVIILNAQSQFKFSFMSEGERDTFHLRLKSLLDVTDHEPERDPGVSSIPHRKDDVPVLPNQDQLRELAKVTLTAREEIEVPKNLPKSIVMLTIGSRGDVQPLVALAKGLMAKNHSVTIATHAEFGPWIESHGIKFHELAGNPAELLELMTQHSIFSKEFIRLGLQTFYSWFDKLLSQSWAAVQGADAVIATPYSFAGFHIAEALGVPFYYICPFPFTRTQDFPQPLITSASSVGTVNYMTHVAFDTVLWNVLKAKINHWRPAISYKDDAMTPVINCFSPGLIPPPVDWADHVHICGFFFLDNPNPGWQPTAELEAFLADKSKKIVYIGFGSIVVDDPENMTDTIVQAVGRAGVKAILVKGWSGRSTAAAGGAPPPPPRVYPDFIFPMNSVPHDWLFERIDGVVHHGGAGTTAAGLRAGLPTVIKPFFGDQHFWAQHVQKLNVGVMVPTLTVDSLTNALVAITTNINIIEGAKKLGNQIREENGVQTAINCLYRDLGLARSIAAKQTDFHASHPVSDTAMDMHISGSSAPGSSADHESLTFSEPNSQMLSQEDVEWEDLSSMMRGIIALPDDDTSASNSDPGSALEDKQPPKSPGKAAQLADLEAKLARIESQLGLGLPK